MNVVSPAATRSPAASPTDHRNASHRSFLLVMPISIQGRVINGIWSHCTCFICDHCGKEIKDPSEAIVDYGHVGNDVNATDFRIYHNSSTDKRPGCSSFYRQEFNSVMLDEFIAQLLHNSKYKAPDRPQLF